MSSNAYLAIYFVIGLIAALLTVKHQHKFGGARPSDDVGKRGANNLIWYLMMITGWPLLFIYAIANLIERWHHRGH